MDVFGFWDDVECIPQSLTHESTWSLHRETNGILALRGRSLNRLAHSKRYLAPRLEKETKFSSLSCCSENKRISYMGVA